MHFNKFNRFDPAIPFFLHSADGGDGGGGGGNTPQQQDNSDEIARKVTEKVQAALSKNGNDAQATIIDLVKKNHSLENAKNTAENKVNELKTQVMTEEQKAEIEAYRALGTKEEIETLKARAEKADVLEREATFKEAASIAKFDADVLSDLATKNNFAIEVKEVDGQDGKKVKQAFVGDKTLLDYATESFPKYLKSLQLEEGQQQTSGIPHVRQPSGEQKASTPLTLEERKARKMEQSEYPTF